MSEAPKLEQIYPILTCRVENLALNIQYVRSSFARAADCCKGEMVVAEIGVYEGINARYMLMAKKKVKLYLIDAWDNLVVYTGGPIQCESYSQLIKSAAMFNIKGFDNVVVANKNSEDAVKDFPDGFFDYVYIDGDHAHDPALRDMRLWYPKVKVGGVLGGHDIEMEEVSSAVEDFVNENRITEWNKDAPGTDASDWWIVK